MVPKNSGLDEYKEKAFSNFSDIESAKILEARGEDVPFLMNQFAGNGKKIFGLTGEDLFEEYKLKQENSGIKVIEKIEWKDSKALFGKPALCLLGPDDKSLEELPKNLTICISAKYKKLAEQYIKKIENQGFNIKTIYNNGCIEMSCSEGIADLIIDIVYTGSSMQKYGLRVFDKIMESDFLVLGISNAIKPREKISEAKEYKPPLENREAKIRLDFNENTSGCSPKVIEVLNNLVPEKIGTYPEYNNFKAKLSEFLNCQENQLLLTNGADEAIKLVIETYVDKEDEILIPDPAFSMINVYSSLSEGTVTEVPYKNLEFPFEELIGKIDEKTKLIIIANPNNPTGTTIEENKVRAILEKAKNAIVLLDEAYYQFSGKTMQGLLNNYDNLVIARTFSKDYGLAGLRIGYLLSNSENISSIQKVASPYNVNSIAVLAAEKAIEGQEFTNKYIKEVNANKKWLCKELGKLGIAVFESETNFILVEFNKNADYIWEKLSEKGILVRSMTNYPQLKNYLRITIGTRKECEILIQAIKRIIRKDALLFDLDGVLVDVSNSYRIAIQKTAEYFAKEQFKGFKDFKTFKSGIELGQTVIPVGKVGCYVPGGRYPLPSTALMCVIPAKVAGVKEIVICSPRIQPVTIVAADIAGADRIFNVGGIQAIGGMAYGTKSIPKVDKIVGPGNKYVTAAKKEVYGAVGIDFIAGPSEVLILADESANPRFIAADLLAQAEHDPNAKPYLVTTSRKLAGKVNDELRVQLDSLGTKETAKLALLNGAIIIASSIKEAVQVSNKKAPEHLELQVRKPESIIPMLTNYGSLFIGEYSAEVFGDYCSGTNHTLPTNGAARYTGGLSVKDFVKILTYQNISKKGSRQLIPIASGLASVEGLDAHRKASEIRK